MAGVRTLFGKKPHRTSHDTPHEAAARWLLRREPGRLTASEEARFAEWLEAAPENQRAWEDVRTASKIVSDGAADPDLMALRLEALHVKPEPRHRVWVAMAASLIVTIAAAASYVLISHPAAPGLAGDAQKDAPAQQLSPGNGRYLTLVGERSALTLSDGSVVTLDTNSAIRVAFSSSERAVYLERGQALFEVAKHKKTPFQVYAGDRRVTAVGTTFDVRIADTGGKPSVKVALIEGRIRVAALPPEPVADAAPETISMVKGEVLTTSANRPMSVVAADTDDVASWRSGVLTFDDTRLEAAVSEMNRYTTHPIRIGDDRINDLRISGVFRSGDPAHFAAVVSEAVPIKVERNPAGALVLRAR